jgi:hypothetical protein
MRPAPKPGFWLVAKREWRWLLHDRAALILIFGVPLFAFAVLTAIWPLAPVANRITATESPTKKACNGLLQQNLPIGDIGRKGAYRALAMQSRSK